MKKDAKSRYSKITILVSLALVIAFVLCTLLVLPLFNKQEDFSDVVEGGIFDKNIRMVGDEPLSNDEAYFYETVVVPENSFGIGNHTIKEVNWSFFWKLFKNHAMWQLEAWHPVNLVWVDNWQGTNLNEWLNITRVRSSDNGSEKVTLNITNMHPSQDLFFRLKFGVDLPALEYINRSSWYEYEITYPCNQTENYTVFFNFSDIQPLVQDGVIIQRHGFTNYQGEDIFYFIISQNMSRNPLQHGNSFEIDPSFGGLNEEIVARGIGVASQFISGEYCWGLSASPASDGTGNYIMAYIKNDDVDDNLKIKGFLYDTTGDDDTVGVTEEVTINANTDYDWIRLNFTGGSPELSLSETYYISVYGEAPTYDTTTPHGTSITGDTGVNTTRNENWNNYPTYENPWVGGIVNTEFELSIYCVYNEVAGNNAPVNSNPEPNNANTSEPLNPTLNITVNDADGDTVSDYDELFVNWTHPFLNDTDGDGYNDSVDGQPNDYTESEFDWICMNLNTSEKFESIQNAIDDGDTLDTHIILIYEGTYNDSNIDVTKNLTFRGEKRETTVFTPDSRLDDVFIIYSQTKEYTVKIENLNITDCCGVSVMGKQTFTLSNVTFYNNDDNLYIWEYSTQYPQDIVISNCSFIKMNDMGVIIQTNDNGVQISNCTFDTCTANYFLEFEAGYRVNLRDTTFSNSSIGSGIRMASPVESTIDNITYNGSGSDIGIYVYDGSWDVNTISNSSISNCSTGIKIDNTYGGYTNTGYMIYSNNISNCSIGLDIIDDFDDSYPNMVYNNIFYGNTINANTTTEVYNISWNTTKQLGTNIIDGEYLGGNYWNDYTGVDTDEDGLGNTEIPYNSSGNITIGGDYLPLTGNLESTPELSSYSCSPTSGVDSYTTFWFNVTWADNEGQTPSDGYLSVNITKTGWYTNQTMNWISGDNTTGAQYSYNTTLTTGGDYNYTFYAYDGILYNSSGPYSNPTVVAQLMSISITQSSAPDANIWFNISKGLIPYYSNETNINASGQTSETPALAIQNTGNIPVNLTLYVNLSPLEGRTIKWDTDNNPTGATTVTESEVQIAEKLMMSDTKNIWLWMDFNSVTPDPPTGETKGRTITITSSSGYW